MALIDYIDDFEKQRITISILKDWRIQAWKREREQGKIEAANESLYGVKTSNLSSPHVSGSSSDGSSARDGAIDRKAIAIKKLEQTEEYFDEIEPCWNWLTDDEKYMLEARFVDHDERDGIQRIMAKYFIGKTEAYNRSQKALRKLAKLLFW